MILICKDRKKAVSLHLQKKISMHTDDEEEDLEFEALLDSFSQAAENDFEGFYMDSEDLFDVISYLIDTLNFELADQGFTLALKLFPDNPEFKLLHAKYSAMQGFYQDAEEELRIIQKLHPDVPETYVEEVILAQITRKEVDNFQLLNKAISLNYELPEAHVLLALEFLKQQDVSQAFSHIQTAISQDKNTFLNLEMLIFPNFKTFDADILIDFITRLTDEYPMQEDVWRLMGMTYFCLGRDQEALNAFQFQYSLNPDNVHTLFNLADCYYRMNDYEQALQQYLEFKKAGLYPVDVLIGKCYFRMKQYDKALQTLMDAEKTDPLYIFKFEEIVKVCRAMDNIPMAQNLLRQYMAQETEAPIIIAIAPRLLSLLHPAKDQEEIVAILDKLFSMDESEYNFFKLLIQLIYYYDTPEAYDLGIQLVEHFQDVVINDTYNQYAIGIFYMEKGWYDKGSFHLEKAFSTMNQDEFEDFQYMSARPYNIPLVVELAQRFGLHISDTTDIAADLFEESDDLSEDYFFDFTID